MSKMSKTLKRIVAAVATFAMALALVPALALADAPTHTITITEPKGNVDSHSYEAYQVFAGTYNSTTSQLENISWGAGVNGTALLQALKDDATISSKFANATDAVTAAAAMAGITDNSADAAALAKVIAGNLSTTKAGTSANGKITVTGDGYYFVKDVSEKLTSDTYSKYILQVCNDVTLNAKDTTTTSQKKVKDVNDSTGDASDWQDSADYDIGDMVPFQLTGTVASDYADYKAPYYFAFHDTHNKTQLSDPTSVTVKIDGKEVTSGYELKTTDAGFDVVFADLKQTAAKAGSVITVEYESQLLSGAQIGAKGNINGSNIEFSNDSNNEQHHGTTPEDTVIVFTYTVNVNKYAEKVAKGNELKGAGFTLYKKYTADAAKAAGKTADADGWVAVQEIAAGENTTFEFKGIDDGEYKLVETTTPAGYNTIDPIVFTVTGTHTVNFESGQVNENGKVGEAYVLTGLTATSDQASFSANTTDGALDGTLSTDVVNKSGSTLPSTGGMGVAPFVLVGCAIAVAAGIGLRVSKSKRENA